MSEQTFYVDPLYSESITGKTHSITGEELVYGINAFSILNDMTSVLHAGDRLYIEGVSSSVSTPETINLFMTNSFVPSLYIGSSEDGLIYSNNVDTIIVGSTITNRDSYSYLIGNNATINGNVSVLIENCEIAGFMNQLRLTNQCDFGEKTESIVLTIRDTTITTDINLLPNTTFGNNVTVVLNFEHVNVPSDKWFWIISNAQIAESTYAGITFNFSNSIFGHGSTMDISVCYPSLAYSEAEYLGNVTYNIDNTVFNGTLSPRTRGYRTLNVLSGSSYIKNTDYFDKLNLAKDTVLSGETISAGQIYLAGFLNVDKVVGNTLHLLSGGTLSFPFPSEISIGSVEPGSEIIFDIGDKRASADALVQNLSVFKNVPDFVLSVSGLQENGVYTLAVGASGFNKVITVRDYTDNSMVGTITVGQPTELLGKTYELSLSEDGALMLTVQGNGLLSVRDLVINKDRAAVVSGGQTASNTTINAGGSMCVYAEGSATTTTVNSGGSMCVYAEGSATTTIVNACGFLDVSSGGTASGIIVSNGASFCFAVAPDTYVQGTQFGSSFEMKDATLSNCTVSNGCRVEVFSGGATDNISVRWGGVLLISSGGTANDAVISGGLFYIRSGGTANDALIKAGNMDAEGELNHATVISDGRINVNSGGTANRISVDATGQMYVYMGGVANDATVIASGWVDVSSGGTVNTTTIDNIGRMYVYSGGIANSTTVNSGGSLYVGLNGWAMGGVANNTIISSGGVLYVHSGGIANGVSICSGGYMDVLSQGAAIISSGDSASNVAVASGGAITVYGTIDGGDVSGEIILGSGAKASGLFGSFTLTIEHDAQNILLKKNDFSKAKLNLNGYAGLDLSGNYFGTSDLQEIYDNLGVTADDVTISHVLSSWPPLGYFAIESSNLNHGFLASGQTSITVSFTDEINPDTVSVDSVRILSADGETNINSLQVDGKTLTVNFEQPAHEGVFRLCFGNGIQDIYGTNLSSINYDNLSDGIADQLRFSYSNSGPAVVKIEPSGDIVGQFSTIKIYFSKTIDPDTLLGNISIVSPDGDAIVPTGIRMLSPSVAELSIPEQSQKGSYAVTLSGGVKDYAGYSLDQDRDGVFNETEDCFSAVFNLTDITLSIQDVTVPATLSVGADNAVSWKTVNESGTAMNGTWTDGVYLSTDAQWDINDKLLATYTHAGMNAGDVLSASAILNLNGVAEGDYYLLVRSDINNDEKDSDNAEKDYVSERISVTVPTLTLGESMAGTVTRKGDFDVYRISGEGKNISITLDDVADTANMELYVGFGYVPTREKYDQKLRGATDGVLSIPGTDSGKDVFIMVYGKSVASETGYTLSADISPMRIDKVVQSSQDMASEITLIVNGANFEQGVSAILIDSNGTEHVPQSVKRASGSQLFITIAADTLSRGKYKLQLNGDKTAEMDDAVTISNSGSGKIEYSIEAPDVVGRHLQHTLYLTIRNSGTSLVDAPLVLFMPTQSHETGPDTTGAIVSLDKSEFGEGLEAFWVSSMPQGYSDSLYFSVSGEIAGQIQAGEELVVPITYNGWLTDDWDFGDSHINWNVYIVYSDNGSPFVWEDVFASSGLAENEKALLCEELRNKYGSTWGGLSRLVQDVSGHFPTETGKQYRADDLKELLNAYVADYLGWHQPLQEIVRESDGSGNSLTIERSWQNDFKGNGSFGYGWSWIWDSELEVGAQGDVTVSCGNSKRLYQPTYMFTYYSAQNDGSSLVSNSKGYLLREKDGSSMQFDEQGRLQYMTGSDNSTIVCTYDNNGEITKLTNNSTGRYLTLDRDANTGFVTLITDSLGNSTSYQYDEDGNLVEASSGDNTSTYGYYGSNEHSLTSFVQNGASAEVFGYDEKGRLVKYQSGTSDLELTYEIGHVVITDKTAGTNLTLEYDSRGNVIKSIDGVTGKTVNFAYDSSGLFVSAADQDGVACSGTITFGGISFESSASVCRGEGRFDLNYTPSDGKNYYTIDGVNYFKINRDGRALGQYDITSEYTIAACDSSTGKMLSYEVFKDGVSTLYTLNEDGSYSVSVDNPAEYTISDGVKYVTRDGNGTILENGYTAENMFTTGYDADGNMVYYSVSSNGKTVTTRYDEHGNVISTETEDGTVSYTYDEAGRNTSVTYEDGSRILFDYYSDGTLRSQTGSDGSRTEYDSHGNITSVVNGEQTSVFINTYDDFGNLISVENDSGTLTTYTYDANGNLTGNSISDHSLTVSRTYDANGNLASLTNADGSVCYYQYDENNNLVSFTDQNGNRTLYAYDDNGNTTSVTYADNTSELFSYDEDGNLLQWTNRAGESISYLYSNGLLSKVICADGRSFDYGYDEQGCMISAGDITFAYDEETKTVSIGAGSGNVITYTQDDDGNTTAITVNGNAASYSYTELGQIDVVSNSAGLRLLDYDYDEYGNLIKLTRANGTYTEYAYLDAGNGILSSISDYDASNHLLSKTEYGYDPAGRVTSRTLADGVWEYTYDVVGQLTGETFTDNGGTVTDTRTYAYDAAGNRISQNINGVLTEYTYNALNQIATASSNGKTFAFRYDANGNMLEDVERIYTWTTDNRIASETLKSTGEKWEYSYNALGHRISSVHTDAAGTKTTTSYLLDHNGNVLAEYLDGVLVKNYILGNSIAGWTDADGNTYYFNSDMLGSVSGVTDSNGNLVNSYRYDAWGNQLNDSVITVDNDRTFGGTIGLVAGDSGTFYVSARNYDPKTGRWLSADPIGLEGGSNLYVYTLNSPLNGVDPTGKKTWSVSGTVSFMIAFGGAFSFDCSFGKTWDDNGLFGNISSWTLGFGVGLDIGLGFGVNVSITNLNSIFDLQQHFSIGYNTSVSMGVVSGSDYGYGIEGGLGPVYGNINVHGPLSQSNDVVYLRGGGLKLSMGSGFRRTMTKTTVSQAKRISRGTPQIDVFKAIFIHKDTQKLLKQIAFDEFEAHLRSNVMTILNPALMVTGIPLISSLPRLNSIFNRALNTVSLFYPFFLPEAYLLDSVGQKVEHHGTSYRLVTLNASRSKDNWGVDVGIGQYLWFKKDKDGNWIELVSQNPQNDQITIEQECGTECEYGLAVIDKDNCHNENGTKIHYFSDEYFIVTDIVSLENIAPVSLLTADHYSYKLDNGETCHTFNLTLNGEDVDGYIKEWSLYHNQAIVWQSRSISQRFEPETVSVTLGEGSYVYTLYVKDDEGKEASADITLTVLAPSDDSGSQDPNDKTAIGGNGEKGYVSAGQKIAYRIDFENDPEFATAPAQWVRVFDVIDAGKFDLDSFVLDEFCIAGNSFRVGDGRDSFNDTVVLNVLGIKITTKVSINLVTDAENGETRLVAEFMAIDPSTGFMLMDVDNGMLPVNDMIGSGEGHIRYSLNAKSDLPHGAELTNTAKIYFDFNDPIDTPTTVNTIDSVKPEIASFSVVAETDSSAATLTFEGADADSGISGYNILYSADGEAFSSAGFTPEDSFIFTGQPGATCYFKVQAVDNVGNISDWSEVKTVTLSGETPSNPPEKPTVSADVTALTNRNVNVTAVFSEDSAVKEYSFDGLNWHIYTEAVSCSENGTVYFRAKNAAGQASEIAAYSVTNIDHVAPEKPSAVADITTTTDQEVTVTAVFSADSVEKEYSFDGQTWYVYTTPIKFSENGTVYFRSADEAGNLSEVTSYSVANIEKVPQIISGAVLINESRAVSSGQTYLDTTVSSGGTMIVSSDGIANNTTINSSGMLYISNGGKTNKTTVNSWGNIYVSSGGTANGTVVNRFGSMYIRGIMIDTTISGGVVVNGGTANSTTVNYYGCLNISNGGMANETIVNGGGGINVYDGWVNNTTINGSMRISSGGTADSTTVKSGGILYVCNGASATNVDWTPCAGKVWIEDDAYVTFASQYSGVYYGSNNQLLSHASVMDSKIVSGYNSPCMYVMSDGFANSTTINEYGSMFVCSGGTAANTRIDSGGYMLVSSGGTATNVDWTPCVGSIWIADGAYVTFTSQYSGVYYSTYNQLLSHAMVMESKTINDDEVMYIMSGGIANATVIDGWGSMYISSGGTANSTTFNDWGELHVCNGGVMNNTTVNSGGDVYISSGGTANNTTISHCNMDVISGGLATNTTVDYWSNLYVSSGGVVDSTTVNYWGNLVVSSDGTADNTTVNSGGDVTVSSGGTANNNIINSGGCLIISSGGTADNTTINAGGSGSLSCGMANSTTINSEGDLYVYSGGTANSTMVNAGGRMTVTSGGSTDNTTVNAGGWMYVYSGGTATNVDWTPCVGSVSIADGAYVTFTSQYSGVYYGDLNQLLSHAMVMTSKTIDGSMYVMSGGLADNTVVSHGSMYVSSGGTANYTSVHSWGGGDVHVRDGGVANNTLLYDGQMLISSGGTANDTVIVGDNSMYIGWGSMYVLHGGTANRTTVNYGGSMYVSGGTANSTTVNSGGTLFIADGGMANDTMIIDVGNVFISSGGMANNTVLNSWGAMHCFAGGTATRTSIEGGRTYIDSDGVADSTTVMAGGLFISSGGMASNTVVFGGGIDISSGGIADNTVIQSGNIYLCDGGIAHNVTISQGRILIYSGGTMTGRMVFEEGVIVSSLQNAAFHLDFDISDLAPETVARVNNLALIKGAPLYTLTVSDKQSIGTYTLAEGASEFNGTISVVNTSGTPLGILTLNGGAMNINGSSYTLHLNKDNVLFVTVNTADMPPSDVAPQTQTWEKVEVATQYTVEYSTDNFEHVIQLVVDSNSLDSFQMPAGNYQMRVKADGGEEWSVAVPVVAEEANNEPKLIRSNADGHADVFFVNSVGTWESGYAAQHVGSTDDDTWDGTEEYASLFGKNKLTDIIEGSTDANVLLMTDDSIGDALFVDDIYSASPDELGLSQSRIAQIDEIRAGAGNDIVDMTSQRFEYIGEGLTIRGGDGNDTIWANKGNNIMFGDAGNDRIVGASGNDVIAGGIGNDRMHGGGGNDIFTFCDNWGIDEVEQLADGSVMLWFTEGSKANWDEATLTYTDGNNSVKVSGVAAEKVTLKFGDDGSEQYAKLASAGAFAKFTSQKIFENADTTTGVIASLE